MRASTSDPIMPMKSLISACVSLLLTASSLSGQATLSWPQFRGHNSSGNTSGQNPPVEFSPTQSVLWKTALPSGYGSPAIWGDRIFLTAFDSTSEKLEVIGLDRRSGQVLWRKVAPAKGFEKINPASSLATSTPAVDADYVYAYFGSSGLLCFSHDGELVWTFPLPVAQYSQGSGTSPVVAGDRIVLLLDESRSAALDRSSLYLGNEVEQHCAA